MHENSNIARIKTKIRYIRNYKKFTNCKKWEKIWKEIRKLYKMSKIYDAKEFTYCKISEKDWIPKNSQIVRNEKK